MNSLQLGLEVKVETSGDFCHLLNRVSIVSVAAWVAVRVQPVLQVGLPGPPIQSLHVEQMLLQREDWHHWIRRTKRQMSAHWKKQRKKNAGAHFANWNTAQHKMTEMSKPRAISRVLYRAGGCNKSSARAFREITLRSSGTDRNRQAQSLSCNL